MDEHDWLAERFEEHRTSLRTVAYRMLGSSSEAEDAVQEAWLRLSRPETGGIENLGGWLTMVVARVCLNLLRSRRSGREEVLEGPSGVPLLGARVPDPIVVRADGAEPEYEAILADGVGLVLLVVLETLSPAERLAFVLHDTFGVPFAEIAPIVGRAPRLRRGNSRAGRGAGSGGQPRTRRPTSPARGRSSTPSSPPHGAATSARSSPCSTPKSCCVRTTAPRARRGWSGTRAVAGQALTYSRRAPSSQPALVNEAARAVTASGGSFRGHGIHGRPQEDCRDRHPR